MKIQHCNCSNSCLFTSTIYKPATNSSDSFLALLVFMLLLSFTRKLTHKTERSNHVSFCHHHLDVSPASVCASSSLLLNSAPNGALQHVRLATTSVFIVFFALEASSSSLGVFQTSSLLLVCSSICSVLNSVADLLLPPQTSCDFSRELTSLLAPKPKCYGARSSISMLRVPTVGTHS